jgi:hypothetical protein
MTARWTVFGLRFFAVSGLMALVVAVLAPNPGVRLLAAIALTCAAAGIALHGWELRHGNQRGSAAIPIRALFLQMKDWLQKGYHSAAHLHDLREAA